MDSIRFTVAGAPQGKGRPRFSRATGHAYTPEKTRSYEGVIRYAAQQAMGDAAPFDGPVTLEISAFFDVPRSWSRKRRASALDGRVSPTSRPDLTNIEKAVEDAINTVVFRDDAQIVAKHSTKSFADVPRLEVAVKGHQCAA